MADSCSLKFCRDLKTHWESKGHEVRYEAGASEHLAQWADLYYVDFVDNNINYLYDLYHDDPRGFRPEGWNNDKKPIFVCRAIDIDVWMGNVRNQALVDWVDKWICIAPHIEKKLREEADFGDKLKLIRPGVNLEKFTLKEKKTDGFQLGMMLGDLWWYKNHMAGLDIFTTLYRQDPRWRLHIRGQHEPGEYNPVMYDHYLESRGIKDVVTLYPWVEDTNEWYENIDILLHPGMKETFTYAVGEALAKGIPVVVNEFYGSKEIWDGKVDLYQTHEEAIRYVKKYTSIPDGLFRAIRTVIEKNYSLEKQLKETDEWLGS